MTWVRGPAFDSFWILSGLPLGAALTLSAHVVPATLIVFWIILVTQTGHLLSPMALAWSHGGFRASMLRRPLKYVGLPASILVSATLIGALAHVLNLRFNPDSFSLAAGPATLAEFKNPFMAMVAIYGAWNSYHFGKQAFGVMSIYRVKNDRKVISTSLLADDRNNNHPLRHCLRFIRNHHNKASRRIDLWYCCTVVWAAMAMPFVPKIAEGVHNLTGWPAHPHPFLDRVPLAYLAAALVLIAAMVTREWFIGRSIPRAIFILTDGLGMVLIFHVGMWGFAIISLNHWLAAIGLAAHVDANANGRSPWWFALAVMAAGFYLFWLLFVDPSKGLSEAALTFTTTAVGFRLGMGFWHFLQDRWNYQLSNPAVRATIGRDLLGRPALRIVHPFPAIAE